MVERTAAAGKPTVELPAARLRKVNLALEQTARGAPSRPSTDALRRAGATGEVIDGLLGWSRGNMRDRYGSGPWIKMLADLIQKVEYPLDLNHLYVR